MREDALKPPTREDIQALVEACFEQGMRIGETVREIQNASFDSLRDCVDKLRYAVRVSTNPACLAMREEVEQFGKP